MATARCSFCSRTPEAAGSIVAGPRGVGICGECAALAVDVASESTMAESADRLVTSIGRLVTNDRHHDGLVGWIDDAAVAVRRGRVVWVGPERHLPARYDDLPRLDAGGRIVCPGFVDAGVSLLGRVDPAEPEAAVAAAAAVAATMLQHGVTSFDVRTGGSQDPMQETVALAAGRALAERVAATVSVTWVVPDTADTAELRRVLVPAASRLAANALVRCDGTEGSVDGLIRAVRPLRPRVELCDDPADCLHAAEGALSVGGASHLSAVDGAVSVVEPGRLFDGGSLPSRKLWDGGATIAVASGNDIARRVIESPALLASLLVDVGGLTIEETLWALTRGGALALGDPERGRLRPGDVADLLVLDAGSLDELVTRPDANWAATVVVGGVLMTA